MMKLTAQWGRKKIRAMGNENTWVPEINPLHPNPGPFRPS